MRNVVIVSAIALAACGNGNGNAASGQARASQPASKPLDVAGVRPGVNAAEARATLERAGWRVESSPGMDWLAKVDQEASRQGQEFHSDEPKRGIEALEANKGDEHLLVRVQPAPSGPTVVSVRYDAPMAGRTAEEVRAQMVKRYGAPDKQAPVAAPLSMTWCSGRGALSHGLRCLQAGAAGRGGRLP